MSHLKTDWLCVATEGDTVDGRVIPAQWLMDMGDTYDIKHYGALIWPEHDDRSGNFGEVLTAMWQSGDDGKVRLFVSICPNMQLLYANDAGQLLYFSIEPEENWRGTGRTYLKGLAVTDHPASVGTTRLRFSRRQNLNRQGYYSCVITPDGKIKQDNKMKGWQKLFGIKPKFEEENKDDNLPDGDKLQTLATVVDALETRVANIESKLTEVKEDVDIIVEAVDTEEFSELKKNSGEIVKRFSELNGSSTRQQRKIQDKDKKFKFL